MSELSLTVTKTISAPVEKVFDAWLDAKMLAKFMMPASTMSVPKAECDGREGGQFLIIMKTPTQEIPHEGTYLEIAPHSRIRFTWQSPHSVDGSMVTLDFAPAAGGATEVSLTQVKFASEGARDGHIEGWTGILDKLAEVLG